MPRRLPVASARFARATPLATDSIDAVPTAFNTGLDDVIRQVVGWTIQTGSAAAGIAQDQRALSPEAAVLHNPS